MELHLTNSYPKRVCECKTGYEFVTFSNGPYVPFADRHAMPVSSQKAMVSTSHKLFEEKYIQFVWNLVFTR